MDQPEIYPKIRGTAENAGFAGKIAVNVIRSTSFRRPARFLCI
jgi:hypothetical protein